MTSKFSRFLNLERSREDRPKPQEPSKLQTGGRFEALAQRGEAPQAGEVPEAHLERFRGEAPLALESAPAEAEHFPRCGRCEIDNGRYAQVCSECGADLNTPQQREYNARLRQSRQALAREQEQVSAELQRRQAVQKRVEDSERAALRERLGTEPTGMGLAELEGSLGMWLMKKVIPFRLVRWGVAAALCVMPFVIALSGGRAERRMAAGLGLILAVLFLPSSSSRRSRF